MSLRPDAFDFDDQDGSDQILKALAEASVAWQSPDQLASTLGWKRSRVADRLVDLEDRGLVETWDLEEDLYTVLTPLGAQRMGVRLVEGGTETPLYWEPIASPEPRPARARLTCCKAASADGAFVVDPNPSAEAMAEHHEWTAASQRVNDPDRLPRPTQLVGLSQVGWPGPSQVEPHQPCPVCQDRPLSLSSYCLYCDRWGADAILQKLTGPASPDPDPAPTVVEPRSRRATTGRPSRRRPVTARAV